MPPTSSKATTSRKPRFEFTQPCPGPGGHPGTITVTVSRGGVLRLTWRPDKTAKTTTTRKRP